MNNEGEEDVNKMTELEQDTSGNDGSVKHLAVFLDEHVSYKYHLKSVHGKVSRIICIFLQGNEASLRWSPSPYNVFELLWRMASTCFSSQSSPQVPSVPSLTAVGSFSLF